MIQDTIIYKNKTILTLYHKNFPQDFLTPHRTHSQHIGKHVIRFSEQYVPEETWDHITDYAWEDHMLLTPKERYNPYGDKACANMTHRVCLDKPSVIRKKNGTTIPEEELCSVIDYIHKYTGMDLSQKPIFLGDIFLFSAQELDYHSNEEHSVVLSHVEAGMKIIIHFRKENNIVESRIVDIEENEEEYEIKADCDWNNHDIQVYKNNNLFYMDTNISYMRTIDFGFSYGTRTKRIPLKALQQYYDLDSPGSTEHRIMGTAPDPVLQALEDQNTILVRKLRNSKQTDDFLFVRPNEMATAVQAITKIIFEAENELWLFDSYFTDKGHSEHQITDWVRLLANSKARKKHIVFYCKNETGAYNAEQLRVLCQQDPIIRDALDSNHGNTIQLLQASDSIHDRFVIIRNGDTYSGLSIGTSLNSLDKNFYCIQKLSHKKAKEVFVTLYQWIRTHLVAMEEIKYDPK